jgi:hypothetical protein
VPLAGTANARRARSGRSSEVALSKGWVDFVVKLGVMEGTHQIGTHGKTEGWRGSKAWTGSYRFRSGWSLLLVHYSGYPYSIPVFIGRWKSWLTRRLVSRGRLAIAFSRFSLEGFLMVGFLVR